MGSVVFGNDGGQVGLEVVEVSPHAPFFDSGQIVGYVVVSSWGKLA